MSHLRLALFLLLAFAISAGAVVYAQTPYGVVWISNSTCSSADAWCTDCNVDIGPSNGAWYCWATTCPQNLRFTVTACQPASGKGNCTSESIYYGTTCGTDTSPCKSWKCSALQPPDAAHNNNSWCDLGTCTCTDGNGDWQGTWNAWRQC